MKLIVRIPLLFGLVVLITSASIGGVSLYISSSAMETAIVEAIRAETNANAGILSAKLTGQLDVLAEIAAGVRLRNMDWEVIQPSLVPNISRIGALDMAVVSPNGVSRYVLDNTTVDVKDRDYFKRAMVGEKNIEVVFSRISGQIVVLFAAPIFQNDEPGAPVVGVLIARKDGGQTLSNLVVNLEISMETGQFFLVDKDGTYIAHRDTELVKNQFNPINEAEKDSSLKSLANVIAAGLSERNGDSRYTIEGEKMLCHYSEVPGFQWLLFSSMEKSEIDNKLGGMRSIILIVGIILLFIGLVIAVIIGRSISKPVASVASMLKDIAEGEGDLTHEIPIHSNDEVGDLAIYFNETLEKIKNLVISIRRETTVLSETGSDLATNMNETAAGVNEIASNIQNIKSRILNQSASVSETHATMEQVTSIISKLSNHIDLQSSNISQASSAIEQMVANTRAVTDTLVKNSSNVQALMEASKVGRNGLHEVADDIQEIARESEGLLEINAVMENIASQTNLLSMNAAIQAARAGEAGKGFSVVAVEVRKLAESSSQQSKTISMVLKKIKGSIDKITIATDNVLNKFEAIDSSVKIVVEQEGNILNAMEEHGTGNKQILEGVSNVNEITSEVRSGSHEMLEGAQEVIKESENLEKITNEITYGMSEMTTGADEINLAIHHINEICVKNRDNIGVLIKEVSRFKVE
jgi:methyl-accepting chemotaxis protein